MTKGALAAALVLVLPLTARVKPAKALFDKKLGKDDQILHALDRLTFGPRPGDVERVKKIGIKKWIDLELHPERIKENPALEAQLEPLESLRMTPMEAVQHYPSPQLIKAIAEGKQPLPEDPLLRSTVERLIVRYKSRKGLEPVGDSAELEPVRPLDEVLEPEELQTLRAGAPDRKRRLLESMPGEKLEDMLIAMPRGQRQQLFNAAPTDVRRKILVLNAPQQVVAYD